MIEFKYRGRKYILLGSNLEAIQGYRANILGNTCLIINNNISKMDKQITLHKLIKGKKLSNIMTGKPFKM